MYSPNPLAILPKPQDLALSPLLVSTFDALTHSHSNDLQLLQMQEILETRVRSLGSEDPLEESMGTHYSILAWRIPWTEEPGWLWSMELQRVRQFLAQQALLTRRGVRG